jgi:hypothetical protein
MIDLNIGIYIHRDETKTTKDLPSIEGVVWCVPIGIGIKNKAKRTRYGKE